MQLNPIGSIESPYKERGDAPRQGRLSKEHVRLIIKPEFSDGLKGIESKTHLVVLYWGDRANRDRLLSKSHDSDEERGVFTSRSPNRPNPIALNVVELLKVEGNVLTVMGLDAFDGSPLLDIKVYSPMLDALEPMDAV